MHGDIVSTLDATGCDAKDKCRSFPTVAAATSVQDDSTGGVNVMGG
jgi:hypothetical protein